MINVCAWCERFLGATGGEPVVTHGICDACAAVERSPDAPVIVVSRRRAELRAVLEGLLGAEPAIRVVIERRVGERRRSPGDAASPGERRYGPDRRLRSADAFLI